MSSNAFKVLGKFKLVCQDSVPLVFYHSAFSMGYDLYIPLYANANLYLQMATLTLTLNFLYLFILKRCQLEILLFELT